MGTLRATEGHLLDLASEEIACSCGVLLADHNLQVIALKHGIEDLQNLDREANTVIGIRPEEFEYAILSLRKAIGNLPDAEPGTFLAMDRLANLVAKGADVKRISDAYITVSESRERASIDDADIKQIVVASGADRLHVYEFLLAMADLHGRKLNFLYRRVRRRQWDGAVTLDRLFQGEHIPTDPEVYLDQRFADYLAQNGEDMARMHWRNFERLVTEFFRRRGYEVELGRGTKDSGVDVRVWTDRESRSGPPLILIQCKRYKEGRILGIETIKAFWSDVDFEGAEKGLIATTSAVSQDGKRLVDARQWPMTFAESAEVRRWVRSMWRHAPDTQDDW